MESKLDTYIFLKYDLIRDDMEENEKNDYIGWGYMG